MIKTGKRYPAEVKKRAVEEVIRGYKSINQVAREVGAVPNTVQKWLEKVQRGQGFQDKPSARQRALEKENEKLKAMIGDLYAQIEFLKKAKVFAQKNKKLDSSIITGENWHLFKKDVK